MEQQDRLPLPGGGRDMSMREMQQQQQQQQRGGKPQQQQQQQQPPPPPPQQPQKCPRCDSLNTKFCYYNNYSLSQPRYFCKTCRRYWTQGGTLRNVPVGGGCRKGKRLKRSSSSSLSPDHNISLNTSSSTSASSIAPLRSKPIDSSLPSSITSPLVPIAAGMNMQQPSLYYPAGGFLSSLQAFHSFNQHQQQQQQQPLSNTGAEFGSSGLSLLQGFNFPFHSQQQQQQMHQLQQQQQQQNLYLHQSHDLNIGSSSDVIEEKIVPSTSHQEWSQRFNASSPSNPISNPESTGGGGYWSNTSMSMTMTMTTTTTSDTSTVGIPLNPTHWTDHLGAYGGPPQPPSSTTIPTTSSSPPSFL